MEVIRKYLEINRFRFTMSANWENFRFVVVDSESTGLNAEKDRLVSLAGMGVRNGDICLWDQFSVVMPVEYNTSSVTVHGITREAAADGVEEPEAIAGFLDWMADGIIVGHHIQHDLTMFNLACQRHFSCVLRNVAVDTMEAYLAVRAAGGFKDQPEPLGYSLDALLDHFKVVPHDRHTAHGDAFLTAQVLLRILKEAGKLGLWNLEDLHAWYADQPFPYQNG